MKILAKLVLMLVPAVALIGPVKAGYPERPLKMVAPWPPGSTTDAAARIVSEALASRLKQTVVVENKPGASGTIGSGYVARSKADGYTLLMANGDTHSVSPHVYPTLPYHAINDFDALSLVGINSFVLIARPDFPADTVMELVEAAKASPGKLTYGTWGVGSAGHVGFAILESAANIELLHVPFQGAAPALTALMAGHVDIMLGSPLAAYTNAPSGKVKILGVAGAERALPWLPEVPTFAEQGLSGAESGSWYGVVAPANLAPEIRERLGAEVASALQDPAVADKIRAFGWKVVSSTPAEFSTFLKEQYERYGEIVRAKGLKNE